MCPGPACGQATDSTYSQSKAKLTYCFPTQDFQPTSGSTGTWDLLPEPEEHLQSRVGLRIHHHPHPRLHQHHPKALIGYTCSQWWGGDLNLGYFPGLWLGTPVRNEGLFGVHSCLISPALQAGGPSGRLWRCRKTLPHVCVWVHWAAVFLWRRWVRDDGSSHPAEP